MNLELQKYIQKSLADGYTHDQIKDQLIAAGWHEDEIADALDSSQSLATNIQPSTEAQLTVTPSPESSLPAMTVTSKFPQVASLFLLFSSLISGLVCIFMIFVSLVAFQNNSTSRDWLTYAPHICLMLLSLCGLYTNFLVFKISRRLKLYAQDGYKATLLYLSTVLVVSVILALFQIIRIHVIEALVLILLAAVHFYLRRKLLHDRYLFSDIGTTYSAKFLPISLGITLVLGLLLALSSQISQGRTLSSLSSDNTATVLPDPKVESWETHAPPDYPFSMAYPQGWNLKILNTPDKRQIVAISPESLPDDYTLLTPENVYLSLRVEMVSNLPEKTYKVYQTRIAQAGQPNSPYAQTTLGGHQGYQVGNTHTVEYNGYIFNLTLRTKPNTTELTETSMYVLQSFTFN